MMNTDIWINRPDNQIIYQISSHMEVKKQKKCLYNFEKLILSSDRIMLIMSLKTKNSSTLLKEQIKRNLWKKIKKWHQRYSKTYETLTLTWETQDQLNLQLLMQTTQNLTFPLFKQEKENAWSKRTEKHSLLWVKMTSSKQPQLTMMWQTT